jgi:hypothetical protein
MSGKKIKNAAPVEVTGIIWGCEAIAMAIGRAKKSTYAALEAGKIPGARKIAGRWGLDPKAFAAAFDTAGAP